MHEVHSFSFVCVSDKEGRIHEVLGFKSLIIREKLTTLFEDMDFV